VVVAPRKKAEAILKKIRKSPLGRKAAVIGHVDDRTGRPGELLLSTVTGGLRLLEPLTSELLPRIC
jgi:hydrogenase maturation factor